MASNGEQQTVRLDWSKLLGFDQLERHACDPTAASRLQDPRLAKIGAGKRGINKNGFVKRDKRRSEIVNAAAAG